MSVLAETRIDPFAVDADGIYRDAWVQVHAEHTPTRRSLDMVRTPHFDVTHDGPLVVVTHRVRPDELDDDLAGMLARELFDAGWLRGPDLFERLFTGVVATACTDGWRTFYANTLRRIEAELHGVPGPAHGTIADYAPVYAEAERRLAGGSVLELGSCFGFLSLRLAAAGRRVIATDVTPGTIDLLARTAPALGIPLGAHVVDATRVPAPDRCVDNVLAVHLLEHLDHEDGAHVLREAVRLARRRVVIAVPLEDEADETWGHVRTFTLADLDALGRSTGLAYDVRAWHGGWLVVHTS